MRRYCSNHGLRRLISLTFAPEHLPDDLDGFWEAVEGFRRRLHAHFGEVVPLVLTYEWGEQGTQRIHAHGVIGRYVDKAKLGELWGLGWVDIRAIKAKGVRGRRADARAAAGYISKYISKGFGDTEGRRGLNRKRYSTTKGTAVQPRRLRFPTLDEAVSHVLVAKGSCPVVWNWSSCEVEDWQGPPVYLIQWGDPPN